jgi:hypothetical protein
MEMWMKVSEGGEKFVCVFVATSVSVLSGIYKPPHDVTTWRSGTPHREADNSMSALGVENIVASKILLIVSGHMSQSMQRYSERIKRSESPNIGPGASLHDDGKSMLRSSTEWLLRHS